MKLKFDFQLKDFKKKEIEGEAGHAGVQLANMMFNSNIGGAKFSAWSDKLVLPPHEIDVSALDKEVLTGWLESVNKDPKSNLTISNGIVDQLQKSIEAQANKK